MISGEEQEEQRERERRARRKPARWARVSGVDCVEWCFREYDGGRAAGREGRETEARCKDEENAMCEECKGEKTESRGVRQRQGEEGTARGVRREATVQPVNYWGKKGSVCMNAEARMSRMFRRRC